MLCVLKYPNEIYTMRIFFSDGVSIGKSSYSWLRGHDGSKIPVIAERITQFSFTTDSNIHIRYINGWITKFKLCHCNVNCSQCYTLTPMGPLELLAASCAFEESNNKILSRCYQWLSRNTFIDSSFDLLMVIIGLVIVIVFLCAKFLA